LNIRGTSNDDNLDGTAWADVMYGAGENDWDTAVKVPWGILILFASGIAIAQAFVETGLSKAVGEQLTTLSGLHPLIIIAFIAIVVTFLTETTSNTATVVLLMPILGPAAQTANIDPALLMLPGCWLPPLKRKRLLSSSSMAG